MSASCTDTAKRRAAIYRKAAASIAAGEEEYSCVAVMHAANATDATRESDSYRDLFSPTPGSSMALQFGIYRASRDEHDGRRDERWCKNLRVLLLCFAAAVAERP